MGGICLEWICVGFVPVIWWCCSDVFVLVWWCSCGVVLAAVFVWWCLCDKPQEEYAKLVTICTENFTEKASKMIVSCEASSKFHRTSFQNERFARCFRQFSQKKLPK